MCRFSGSLNWIFMKYVESANNQQLKQVAKLLNLSKERRKTGCCVLEGVHLLQALLDSGGVPVQVWIPKTRLQSDEVVRLLARLDERVCVVVAENVLAKISSLSDADDVITVMTLPERTQPLPVRGDVLVLDRVQDPSNIGAILRSAAASGIKNVILGEGCADAYSPKVLRAGMGAHFLLNVFERVQLVPWCENYQGRILATALRLERHFSLYELDLKGENAWIFGNEGSGVAESLLQIADASVMIPMLGKTESLNVAMAATVCLFEQMRQRLLLK